MGHGGGIVRVHAGGPGQVPYIVAVALFGVAPHQSAQAGVGADYHGESKLGRGFSDAAG